MTLLWVRHGESTWNRDGREQGRAAHPPLTELGRRQVAEAAARLVGSGHRLTALVCSPALRARQSADILGQALGLAVQEDPLLVERAAHETPVDVLERVRRVLERHGRAGTVLVSHGDLVALAVASLTGTPPRLPGNAEVIATPAPADRPADPLSPGADVP